MALVVITLQDEGEETGAQRMAGIVLSALTPPGSERPA
jgi:hypothetical protein